LGSHRLGERRFPVWDWRYGSCVEGPCALEFLPHSLCGMTHTLHKLFSFVLLANVALAAPKPHIVSFGKWTAAKWFVGPEEKQTLDLKVRALYVASRF